MPYGLTQDGLELGSFGPAGVGEIDLVVRTILDEPVLRQERLVQPLDGRRLVVVAAHVQNLDRKALVVVLEAQPEVREPPHRRLRVYASEEAHSSVDKAAKMLNDIADAIAKEATDIFRMLDEAQGGTAEVRHLKVAG